MGHIDVMIYQAQLSQHVCPQGNLQAMKQVQPKPYSPQGRDLYFDTQSVNLKGHVPPVTSFLKHFQQVIVSSLLELCRSPADCMPGGLWHQHTE